MTDKEDFEKRPLIEKRERKGISDRVYSLGPLWRRGAGVVIDMSPDVEKEPEEKADESMTPQAAGDSPPSYPEEVGSNHPTTPVQSPDEIEASKDIENITSCDPVTSSEETASNSSKLNEEETVTCNDVTLPSAVDMLSENNENNKTSKQYDTDSEYCDCKSQVSETSQTISSQENCRIRAKSVDSCKDIFKVDSKLGSPSRLSICSYPQSTQTTLNDFCRICHCEGDSELGPLIAPCYCRGSLRYVHHLCLQKWIKSSDTKHCELCGYHFVMDSKLKPFYKWKKLSMSKNERRKILCSVMFHIIAITCVIWSLYVLIEKTASEIQEGKLQWPFWTKLVVVAIGITGGLVFMYVQCKVYVQLWNRLKAFNRVIYVKNNSNQSGAQDDDTVADGGSITSDVEQGAPQSVSNGDQSSRTRDNDVVIVDVCCRDNH